eukprot:5322542-Amphidinium_carterae.1
MGCMGPPIGVWNIDDWQRIETSAQSTLWLGHAISAWAITDAQLHLNVFTAITMLNTRSMSQTFHNWCDQNNLTGMLLKHLEADGTIKQQYVVAEHGVERDHKRAMALHRWHKDNHMVLSHQQMAIFNEGQQCRQWHRVAVDKPDDNLALIGDNDS